MTHVDKKQKHPRTAMVIVAHPDDAEFLCGGTVAKLVQSGWKVYYMLTTSGDMGSKDPEMTREKLGQIREEEQSAACDVLGVKEVVYLRYPDGFVEDTAEMRGRIVRELRRLKPHTVITWNPFRSSFTHRDHRLTGQAAVDAVFPLARDPLAYPEQIEEGLQAHRVMELLLAGDNPDYWVEIPEEAFKTKIAALRKHKSQIGSAPLPELKKRLRARMKEAGKENGYQLAEGFRRMAWS
ncbi:MAG TPA: PIG-L deacetylase family protein [Dehalococcoidia bacterium]